MKKRDELRNLQKVITDILENNTAARNSDDMLYMLVCGYGDPFDTVGRMNVDTFFLQRKQLGYPSFESVSRARRKVQQDNPWLASDCDVTLVKQVMEEEFRRYARGM